MPNDHQTEIEQLLAQAEATASRSQAPSAPRVFELRPVLAALPEESRPPCICGTCPASLWTVADGRLSCYCRVQHCLVHSPEQPTLITDCDQIHLPIE